MKKLLKCLSLKNKTLCESTKEKDDEILKNNNFWPDWNYNVGHEDSIEDRYNSDLIAFMSHIVEPEIPDITMIYKPKINNECYIIKSDDYLIYQFNEINISSSSSVISS
tara:strand:+ start:8166 stop:8492 length:327 start_codon:yes stop_codon:yes gene_type:complete